MRSAFLVAALVLIFGMTAAAQEPGAAGQTPTASGAGQRQQDAASATRDNSAVSRDPITKPAASKGSTLIGCLSGPGKDGKYLLRSMSHRTGVEVVGPEEFKKDSGAKVKLTGEWQPLPGPPPTKKGAETRRFQATAVEVMAQKCEMPAEDAPVSKQKERQKKMEEEQQKNDEQANPR